MFKLLISLSSLAAISAEPETNEKKVASPAAALGAIIKNSQRKQASLDDENRVFREYVFEQNPNYEVESHNVYTADGFVLKVFNIKGDGSEVSRNGPGEPKPVVFLQHGLIASSETFVQNGDNSLAFKLVEAGYDVWLGNNRGNIYSRKNLYYQPWGKQYFDFSFYEMGEYDLPAMIDYALIQSNQKKLSYIAHSLGTTQMFTALAENYGGLKEKLDVFIAMAPVAKLDHTKNNFFVKTSQDADSIQWWLDKLYIHELFGPQWQKIKKGICWIKKSWCEGVAEELDTRKVKFDTNRIPEKE